MARNRNETPAPVVPTYTNVVRPPNAPSWWNSRAQSGSTDSLGNATNALLPFLSPYDQTSTAMGLGNRNAQAFGSYLNSISSANPPKNATGYLNAGRASQALASLNNMMAASGMSPSALGPGYNYLTGILNTMQRLGGGANSSMSRENYMQFRNALGSLSNQYFGSLTGKQKTASNVTGWENLANSFVNPTLSGGNVNPVTDTKGKISFGQPNPKLVG